MIVTADGQQYTFAPSPASMTALLSLAKTDAILLWDPAARTLIAANIVGTWLAPTGLTRVAVTTPRPVTAAVGRRLVAEFTGTGLLVAVVVGSGIAATRLTTDGALRLLVNSVVTALGLAVLIVVFSPASGAHFNPVVTAADWILGRGTPRSYGLGQATAVIACQFAGAITGAALADAMFAEPILSPSHHHRGGVPVLLSEVVATAGPLFVIVSLVRTGRIQHVAWAVGAWIGAAYWFTASTSFANPAVTIGRTLTSTYAGIAPASAPAFIAAQLIGGVIGTLLAVVVYPARPARARTDGPVQLTG
jgi:glycerol uptake facilitator-like aquaporin